MKDVRPKAEERARQRVLAANATKTGSSEMPLGSGFISERARAKEARKQEVNALTGDGVRKIAAVTAAQQDDRILRVAAYCRVSTDDIDQALSIELQKANYRDMIRANPKWKYVGTYVDDGFSGTNTDHRPAFRLMMKDAMAGKIDMIITKSVSRFARNLLDCIGWVRELKDKHDPPIQVFFEQEHLNTMDATSNIILFVLAMVAEEESHMKSEAMLLSLEWRFSRGRFLTPALLGYDKIEVPDGHGGHRKELVVNEDEARTVRLMYYMLLNGSTTAEIAETLNDLHRETGLRKMCGKVSTKWTSQSVACVLRNERYCGDVLARKTWTPDFHDHKSKRNNGKKNKYYQPGHHEAIVTRAQWNAAQRILNSHRYKYSGSYLQMRVIDHGALRGYISVNRAWAGTDTGDYFRVSNIAMGIDDGEIEPDLGSEHLPERGYRLVGMTEDNGVQRIARTLTSAEEKIKAQLEGRDTKSEEQKTAPRNQHGYQVVSGSMFHHAFEATISFWPTSMRFSTTCVSRMPGLQYVELLLNPVERMLAVRPCSPEHPNAICWKDTKGHGNTLGAKSFCGILYEILDWDMDYAYSVPAVMRKRGNETILFFDLDNFIGREIRKINIPEEPVSTLDRRIESDDTRGIFFGAEDDEPQPVEDTEEIERRIQALAEQEKRSFGTPAFEHSSDFRLTAIDDDREWDVMAEARVLGSDHRVDQREIDALHSALQGGGSR